MNTKQNWQKPWKNSRAGIAALLWPLKLGGNMPNTLYHPQNLCPAATRCIIHLSFVSPDSPKLGKKKFDHALDLKRNIGEPSRCPRWQCFSGDGLFLFLMELSLLGFRSWKQERFAN